MGMMMVHGWRGACSHGAGWTKSINKLPSSVNTVENITASFKNPIVPNICSTYSMSGECKIPKSLTKQLMLKNQPGQKITNEALDAVSFLLRQFIIEARNRSSIEVCRIKFVI